VLINRGAASAPWRFPRAIPAFFTAWLFSESDRGLRTAILRSTGASGGSLLACSLRIPRKPPFKRHDGGTAARWMASITRECGLSTGHFSRAFRQSTGLSPHQWLLQRRIDAARACLRDRDMPLSEVALACGFADQSHFTGIFTRCVGVSPGAWRRSLGE
jgi:AraC-like DNA-binding protein